jgi:hypothetical protein
VASRNNRVFCLTSTFLAGGSEKRPPKPDFCSGRKTGRREGAAYDRSSGQHNALRAAGRARTGPPGGGGCDGGAHRRGARPRAPFAVPARRPALMRGRPLLAGRVPARIDPWLGAGCQARPRSVPGGLDGAGGVEAGCLRSRAAGQPAPPAGIRAGCHCPRQRRGRARGHRPGPPRARPAGLPLRQGRTAPGNDNRSRPAPRHPGRRPRNTGRPAADHRGGDRRAAGIPGGLLPLAPAGSRPAAGEAAGRRGAGPAQRAQRVAAPSGRRRDSRGARSRWTVTTSGSGTPRRSATTPAGDGTGSGGPSTGRSTASRSRTRPSPTGSSTASRTPPATGGRSAPAPACPPPRRPRARWSPGTSTPAATPRPSGRTWPRSRAARSPSPWSP